MAVTSAKNLAEKRYNRSEEQRIAALASVAALTPKPPTEEQEAFKEAQDALKQQTLDAKRTGEMENAAEMAKLIDCVNFIATTVAPLLGGVCDNADKLRNVLVEAAPRAAEAASEENFVMSGAAVNDAVALSDDAAARSLSPASTLSPSSDAKRVDRGGSSSSSSSLGLSPLNGGPGGNKAAATAAATAATGGGGLGLLLSETGFSMLKAVLLERLGEQEHRHRIEVQELEHMSHRALESMAKGWAECRGQLERSNENSALLTEECRIARAQADEAAEEVTRIAEDYHRHVRQIGRGGGGGHDGSISKRGGGRRDPWRSGKRTSPIQRTSPIRMTRGHDDGLVDARLVAVDRLLNENNGGSRERGGGKGGGIGGGGSVRDGTLLPFATTALNVDRFSGKEQSSDDQRNGPQIELFIWRAAMKHAEDLREERSARHQETTSLHSALALEASTFGSSAAIAMELCEQLRGVQRVLHERLWRKSDGDDADSVVIEVDSVSSSMAGGRGVAAFPPPGLPPMESSPPVTMHDIDQRTKVAGAERKNIVLVVPQPPPGPSPKNIMNNKLQPPKAVGSQRQDVITPVGPPALPPPPINPLLAMMAMASPPMSPPPVL